MVRFVLKIEGLAVFLLSLWLYWLTHGNWWVFMAVLLVPDASMIGYLKDKKLGATIYNLVHNYALAIVLFLIGFALLIPILQYAGIILLAHVGMDRLMGFGLKYKTDFKDTHLQRV